MKQVPYHGNPGNACALACYTMVAQYLLPNENITFEQLGKIANWKKGYVVWAFPVWKWMMDKGMHVVDYDVIDYEAWAREGVAGLKKAVSPKEFEFYEENTYDLEATSKDIKITMDHPNFTYVRRKLRWGDVVDEFNKPGICDITVDGFMLHGGQGFSIHRVVLLDITDKEVVIHDPTKANDGAYRHVPLDEFRANFESLDGPELARYSLE